MDPASQPDPARSERVPAIQEAVNERAQIHVDRDRLYTGVDRLRAGGAKLYAGSTAEGDKVWLEGNLALINAVIETLGNDARISWLPNPIINGVVYTPETA